MKNRNNNFIWRVYVILAVSLGSMDAGMESYIIDLTGPARLTELPLRIPMPTRVDVHVSQLKTGHDKTDLAVLLERKPVFSTTNFVEIKELVSALRENDNQERVKNQEKHQGCTYHVLLFQDASRSVMHFRVLEFSDLKTEWYGVWPRSDTGFGYFNKPVGVWLKAHRGSTGTNGVPAVGK